MNSLLLSFIDDWGRAIGQGLGRTWLIVFIIVFLAITLFMFTNIFIRQVAKSKFKFKWIQMIFMVIFALFTVWFCIILSNM